MPKEDEPEMVIKRLLKNAEDFQKEFPIEIGEMQYLKVVLKDEIQDQLNDLTEKVTKILQILEEQK